MKALNPLLIGAISLVTLPPGLWAQSVMVTVEASYINGQSSAAMNLGDPANLSISSSGTQTDSKLIEMLLDTPVMMSVSATGVAGNDCRITFSPPEPYGMMIESVRRSAYVGLPDSGFLKVTLVRRESSGGGDRPVGEASSIQWMPPTTSSAPRWPFISLHLGTGATGDALPPLLIPMAKRNATSADIVPPDSPEVTLVSSSGGSLQFAVPQADVKVEPDGTAGYFYVHFYPPGSMLPTPVSPAPSPFVTYHVQILTWNGDGIADLKKVRVFKTVAGGAEAFETRIEAAFNYAGMKRTVNGQSSWTIEDWRELGATTGRTLLVTRNHALTGTPIVPDEFRVTANYSDVIEVRASATASVAAKTQSNYDQHTIGGGSQFVDVILPVSTVEGVADGNYTTQYWMSPNVDHARGTSAPNGRAHFSEEGAVIGGGQTVTTSFDTWLGDLSPTFNGSGEGLAVLVNGGTQTTLQHEMDSRWVHFRWPKSIERKLGSRTLSKATVDYDETKVFEGDTTTTADDVWVVSATRREFWGLGATDYLETVTKRYRPDTPVAKAGLRDRLYSVKTPAGTKQSYHYEFGAYASGVFTPAATGPDLRISVLSGAASGGNLVTGLSASQKIDSIHLHAKRSTKVVEILQRGRLVRREMFVYLSGDGDLPVFTAASAPVMWESFEYTDDGRLKKRLGSNNTYFEVSWQGARKAWEMDETGLKTHFIYDARNRIAVTTRESVGTLPEVRTEIEYDGADRVRFTSIGPGDTRGNNNGAVQANKLITEVQYDLGGRVKKKITPGGAADGSTFAPGITVQYSYVSDDLEITETLPPGSGGETSTKTTKRFVDGRLRSITGPAVPVEEHYNYTFNVSNQPQTTVKHTAGANKRPKTTTFDLLGRVAEEQVDGFVTGTSAAKPIITKHGYHANGMVNSITVAEMTGPTPLAIAAERVIEYDPDFGTVNASGLNLNGTAGLQAESTDRFTTTKTFFDQDTATSSWWTVTQTSVFDTDGTNSALTSAQWSRVSGFPAGVVSQTDFYDYRQNRSAEIVTLDGAGKARIVSALAADGTTTAKTMVGGVVVAEKVTNHGGTSTQTTTFTYDGLGRQTQATDPRLVVKRTEYHARTSQPWKVYDGRNEQNEEVLAATITYDAAGRVVSTTDAKSATVETTYYPTGQLRQRSGTGTQPVEFVYDQLGQQTELRTYRNGTGGTADRTVWNYDDNTGWLKAKKLGVDAQGNATQTINYGYSFSSPFRLVTRSSPRGITITNKYSLDTGELRVVDYSDATSDLTYHYTRTGYLDSVVDATGTRAFSYDSGQLEAESLSASWHGSAHDGLVLITQFDHNVPNNESAKVVPGRYAGFTFGTPATPQRELKVTLAYDSFGRVQKVAGVHPNQTINGVTRTGINNAYTYQYTANTDFWQSVNNGAFTIERRLETGRDVLKRATAKWSVTTVAEHVYTTTNAGARDTVAQSGTAFSNSAFGGYGESTFVKYGYNLRGEMESAVGYLGGTTTDLSRPLPGRGYGFTYDTAGNRQTASVDTETAGYTDGAGNEGANLLNQVKQRDTLQPRVSGVASSAATVTVEGTSPVQAANQHYWDAALNLFGQYRQLGISAMRSGQTQTASIWAILKPESEPFTYDNEGNLTGDALWRYDYDAENRLIRMTTKSWMELQTLSWTSAPPPRQIDFSYDYLGRRVAKVVQEDGVTTYSRRYVYAGWNLIAEFELSGGSAVVKRSYAWGLDVQGSLTAAGGVGALLLEVAHTDSALAGYQVASDGQGNVTTLLASGGGLAAVYEYDPYGQLLRCEGLQAKHNPFTYSSKYSDGETGLLYYGLRYYDASLGRFINRDPIEEAGGLNLYAFTLNNPVTHFDRLGMETDVTQMGAFTVNGRRWTAEDESMYQAWLAFQLESATAFFDRGAGSMLDTPDLSLAGAAQRGDLMPTATKQGSLMDISRRLGYAPVSAAEKSNLGREIASVVVGSIPVVGSVLAIVELITGRDYVAGTKTSRWLAGVGVVAGVFGAKGIVKGGAKVISHAADMRNAAKAAESEFVPRGFASAKQFAQASGELETALARSGITDARFGVRGSSITGWSAEKGLPFRAASDIDFFVESGQLSKGFSTSGRIPGFVHPDKILGAFPELETWSSRWSGILRRDVTPGAFTPGSISGTPMPQPILWIK